MPPVKDTLAPSGAAGQGSPAIQPLDRPLRVFLDCRTGGCDQEFFRIELAWVDHVRDQNDADVHVLVTGQGTGGGGTEFTIRFIGQGQWDGQADTLRRNTEAAETDDGRRRALARALALPQPASPRLSRDPSTGAPPPAPARKGEGRSRAEIILSEL